MQKHFAYALCASMAGILAVIYTLLQIDWADSMAGGAMDPPAGATAPAEPAGQ
jgi:hypothetical protein